MKEEKENHEKKKKIDQGKKERADNSPDFRNTQA